MTTYLSGFCGKQIVIGFLVLSLLLMQAAPVLAQTGASETNAEGDGAENVELLLMPQVAAAQGAEPQGAPPVAPHVAEVAADVLYHHQDVTGNLVAKTDAGGQVVWRANSRPFGQGSAVPAGQPVSFAGQPQEADIGDLGGLYHLGVRHYDPVSGRFMSADPLSLSKVSTQNPQLFNRYAYALNNPYRFEDPSGLQPGETIAGPSPGQTLAILQQMANDPYLRPDVRQGAAALVQRLEQARRVLQHSPDNVSREQVRAAIAVIRNVRGVVAQAGVSEGALLDTLENIGEGVRRGGAGGRGGGGGAIISALFILIALPSIAEAATDERYGNMVAQILNLLRPPDFIMPLSPTMEVKVDPATGEVHSKDLLTWLGDLVDSFVIGE